MSMLSAAVASSANSQSLNEGSLVFNPILVLDSPEASIRASHSIDTSARFSDTSSSSTARAKAVLSTTGEGGGDGEEGYAPGAVLGSTRTAGSLAGDLVPRQGGGFMGGNSVALLAVLGAVGFVLWRKFA